MTEAEALAHLMWKSDGTDRLPGEVQDRYLRYARAILAAGYALRPDILEEAAKVADAKAAEGFATNFYEQRNIAVAMTEAAPAIRALKEKTVG